ncbi:hypothetical protein [Lottiidibacillus patelloidae]|uniref:hypothetical protein n=1 Tax=Lottiidibacillus patelloidae TaxID=2670334 RepID=UPI0011550412|nr:hypothetical protein [Lottiidibacillus patelloidae]
MQQYIPSIKEGFIPEDGGWTTSGQGNTMLLSIPQLKAKINQKLDKYSYAWLYDKKQDAYIFCFQLDGKEEYAILFQAEYAGKLLLEQEAYERFTVAITDLPFGHLTEQSNYLIINEVEITRQPIAGW